MLNVLIKILIIYPVFIIIIRLMGKRQVGQLQLSELVTTFLVSELAVLPIQSPDLPIHRAIIPMLFLLCIEIIVSFAVIKSPFIKKLLYGNPSIIIIKGEINQKELRKLRIGINELLEELRIKNVFDISQVEYAILEQNGQLAIFLKEEHQALTIGDVDKKTLSNNTGDELSHAVVLDGRINESNLKLISKNKEWVLEHLSKKKLKLKDVFLMTVNNKGIINIVKKKK
ncbi:MAG: DUF421 domain-containing protein [Clostridia bacterium]|nr:DUF421 domain-containing protein [Clostridia bacterium]